MPRPRHAAERMRVDGAGAAALGGNLAASEREVLAPRLVGIAAHARRCLDDRAHGVAEDTRPRLLHAEVRPRHGHHRVEVGALSPVGWRGKVKRGQG